MHINEILARVYLMGTPNCQEDCADTAESVINAMGGDILTIMRVDDRGNAAWFITERLGKVSQQWIYHTVVYIKALDNDGITRGYIIDLETTRKVWLATEYSMAIMQENKSRRFIYFNGEYELSVEVGIIKKIQEKHDVYALDDLK